MAVVLTLTCVRGWAANDEEEDIPLKPEKKPEPARPAGQPPAQNNAPKAEEKPKPKFEKGKAFTLFPAGVDSKTVDHQSPAMQQGQKSGINETKFDGWSYMGMKLDGWSVKNGVMNIDGQCGLTLDGFPFKDYRADLEVEVAGLSGLALMLGSAKEGVQLLAITPTHLLPGVFDQTKQGSNVQFDNKAGKPHGSKGGWIPLQITVAQGWVDVSVNQKSVYKERMQNVPQFSQFGFLMLGLNGNKDPKAKVRKATLTGM
ncbi:MAG: hypothetical protein KIS92_00010 [Planctomycetota bacterium]|nr:hypothetical protein [Planctomycetota bacterium]